MVNTRRLESLIHRSATLPVAPLPAWRSLALPGSRDLDHVAPGALRNRARAASQWAELSHCAPTRINDRTQRQINRLARQPEVTDRFDILRTQLLQTFRARGMTSLGITAPRRGTGASFVTAGLTASLARRADMRVIALDLDLPDPALHRCFEITPQGSVADLLARHIPPADVLQCLTETVALATGDPMHPQDTSPCVLGEGLGPLIDLLHAGFAPELILCDLPPLLEGDLAMSMVPHLDAVLLVADSTRTTAAEITTCTRALSGNTACLGAILNHHLGHSR